MEMSDLWPYICAILALLLIWQYHQNQVLTGRIQAVDIFDRSGIRMYVYATPDDDEICESCREVNGMAFLPSRVARKDFSPRRNPCANKGRCPVVMVGLYGAWQEARQVVQQLRSGEKEGMVQLPVEELIGLTKGNWQGSVSAATDRLSVVMLGALTSEDTDPSAAIAGYQQIIQQAAEVRDLPLVVPAYLRLTDLLDRQGRSSEALGVIEDFEKRFPPNKTGPYYPKGLQRGLLTIKKSHLKTALNYVKSPAAPQSPSDTEAVETKSIS